MELEFDKEIDAILRKTRPAGGLAASSPHLDADVIAAFAENAVPEPARLLYTKHLADCDQCRTQLSQTISMNEGGAGAPVPVTEPITAATIPWYQSIFRTPGLAVAMGGLVLVFTGVLGFLVIQNNQTSQSATVTQVTERETMPSAPRDEQVPLMSNSNAASQAPPENVDGAVTMVPTAGAAANSALTDAAGSGSGVLARRDLAANKPTESDDRDTTARSVTAMPSAAAPPPPPVPATELRLEGATADRAKPAEDPERKQAELSDASLEERKKRSESARARDLPPPSAKVGPARGPVQMQSNQVGNLAGEMTVTRSVGGRKFTNRDGAWYDTAYRGQATTNVKRGTDEFKKLDSGLRSIANQLDGVVVVVWKNKAIRIQ